MIIAKLLQIISAYRDSAAMNTARGASDENRPTYDIIVRAILNVIYETGGDARELR